MSEFDPAAVVIEEAKILDYLLAPEHPVGGAKARFFIGHGFDRKRPDEFAEALRGHLLEQGVGDPIETGFGTKWISEGPMRCPNGEKPAVRAVWILDSHGKFPRLVSAYPLDETK